MPSVEKLFHLAIPCADLKETERFYSHVLGCKVGRRYEDRITFDFFGDQLVCHLAPEEVPEEATMYPRHFGVTFRREAPFQRVLEESRRRGARFFRRPFTRFEGERAEHRAFFLQDPANNLIEFKHYRDPAMMY